MEDRSAEFRVGLMVIAATCVIVFLVVRFGNLDRFWTDADEYVVVLPNAAGVYSEAPVKMNGMKIGRVKSLQMTPDSRAVVAMIAIDKDYRLPNGSVARTAQSLLGDGSLEIVPGREEGWMAPGSRMVGYPAADPMQTLARLESQLSHTMGSFEATSQQWGALAANLNSVIASDEVDIRTVVGDAARSLRQFADTMQTADEALTAARDLLNDPEYQRNLAATLGALPNLLKETETTLSTVNSVVRRIDGTLAMVNDAADPLAKKSHVLVGRLEQSLTNLQAMTGDLAMVSRQLREGNGTASKLLTDAELYQNLNSTAGSLSILLKNLSPVINDLQVFSDKIARHPELMGVRGVVKGSDGLKVEDDVRRAGFSIERP